MRSVAGVELGEDMAVEATLELDIAEDVRAGAVKKRKVNREKRVSAAESRYEVRRGQASLPLGTLRR